MRVGDCQSPTEHMWDCDCKWECEWKWMWLRGSKSFAELHDSWGWLIPGRNFVPLAFSSVCRSVHRFHLIAIFGMSKGYLSPTSLPETNASNLLDFLAGERPKSMMLSDKQKVDKRIKRIFRCVRSSVRPSTRRSVRRSVLHMFFQWTDCGRKWSEMTGKTV